MNTVKEDKDCNFITEKILDNENNLSQFELEEIPDKSWSKGEFMRELKDWSDVKELITKEIISIVELTTT